MRYSLLAGGKRLRPMLALAAAEAIALANGADVERTRALALPAACALELIHTYSLIHDDLPAMDDDTLRRGRPTSHVVFGEGLAILAGDGLLTEAFALLAREPADARPPRRAQAPARSRIVADAAGPCGMVGGQAHRPRSRRHRRVVRRATGSARCTRARPARSSARPPRPAP